jgi:hypothetical protein
MTDNRTTAQQKLLRIRNEYESSVVTVLSKTFNFGSRGLHTLLAIAVSVSFRVRVKPFAGTLRFTLGKSAKQICVSPGGCSCPARPPKRFIQ